MAKQTEKKELEGITLITPVARTRYNHLNKPDEYKGKKTFKTEMVFTPDQLDEFREEVEELIDAKYEEVLAETKSAAKRKKITKKYPWIEEEDDDGEETGNTIVRFKSNPKKNGKRRFPIVDSQLNETNVLVWGGSKIAVEAYFKPYFMESSKEVGVTPYIHAVQIIELAGDAGGNSHSFAKRDGGYVADDDDDFDGGTSKGEAEDEEDEGTDDF